MALKRAMFYTSSKDERCAETQKFIESAGIILDVRDMSKQPLTEDELARLIGNLELQHFLNPAAESYDEFDVDKHLTDRHAVIKLIAKDNTLLRRPIIRSTRLISIGHDRRKISDMLQIKMNGNGEPIEDTGNINNSGGRHGGRREESAAAK